MSRITTATAVFITAAAMVVGVAGCSAEATPTVSADAFATVVADALEESVGQRPVVDCGDEAIGVVDGDEVHCDIGAAGDDTVYDSVSTISADGGGDYSVAVEVDQTPRS
ncbi:MULTISPECIES: hypothetical protein [unclassified Frigoribacterium]|uniref:hypothetical protein n=1 Tax=unclassified Frigoribacterium TaxID=2627005 RepID=UPI000B1D0A9C|nr:MULTISPECIES: hypothetical protein [unclassified Frigoribacterium]